LAKLASDWRKPDGLFVIQPEEIDAFLLPLPVGSLPGVGKVTGDKLAQLGAQTVRDLRTLDLFVLEEHFGRYGQRLHELAEVSTIARLCRTGPQNRYRSRILLSATCR